MFRSIIKKNIRMTRLCHHDSKLEKYLVDIYRSWDDNETKKQLENNDKAYKEYIDFTNNNNHPDCPKNPNNQTQK